MGGSSEKRGKKAQVTVFVLLGFVLLVSFGLVIFFVGMVLNTNLERQAQSAVEDYLKSSSISYYVYTCMDAATTNSADQLFLQGGVFYDYQDGPYVASSEGKTHIPFNISVPSNEGNSRIIKVNVSYSILNQSSCPLVNETIPYYPLPKTKLELLENIYEDRTSNLCLFNANEGYANSGFFGLNNITTLCYIQSSNSMSISNISSSPCQNNKLMQKNSSIEYLLEMQIKEQVQKCINFTHYETEEGHNITIINEPEIKILYDRDSFSVKMQYPFSVKLKGKEPIIVKQDFEFKSNLKIVSLHNFVLNLLKKDSSDPFFNLSQDYIYVNGYDSNRFAVKTFNFTSCNNCLYKYDKILVVEDNLSKIGNRSLSLITAIKNRKPALDYIHETAPNDFFDIVVTENQTITLEPTGIDPDDKYLTYTYSGWKETWDDTCSMVGTPPVLQCTKISIQPKNWSLSEAFIQTGRIANYTTNSSDLGFHNTTIYVQDESGLTDYQTINILVFDLPRANLTIPTLYPGMPDNTLTIEDPINISGDGSQASLLGGGTITGYLWRATYIFGSSIILAFENKTTVNYLTIPFDQYNIKTIKELNLSNATPHQISLIVEQYMPALGTTVSSLPVIQDINVSACAPHRNSTNPNAFPYNLGSNPFYANHSCCIGNIGDFNSYQLATSTSSCFTGTAYGEFNTLLSKATQDYTAADKLSGYSASGTITPAPASYPSGGDKNDIYKMTFTRNCDGKRGNICAGDMTRTITLSLACASAPINGVNELCVGPPETYQNNTLSCVNYPQGQTFETTFGSGTGICNTQPICSNMGLNGYGATGGKNLCTATCDGSGQCDGTLAANCQCSINQCGAECDSTKTFEWSIGSPTCKSSCNNPGSCTFQTNQQMPCTKTASSNQFCLYTSNQPNPPFSNNTCYYGLSCSSSGASYQQGQYCAKGEYTESGVKYCLWGTTASCTQTGNCSLTRTPFPCGQGQTATCNPNTGWGTCTGSSS